MEATIREARMAGMAAVDGREEAVGVGYAASSFLSELPGMAVGLITLVYIVSSLVSLL